MSAIWQIIKSPHISTKNHLILMKFSTQQHIWNSMTMR